MKKLWTLILAALLAMPAAAQFKTAKERSRYNHKDTEHYYGLRLGMNVAVLNSDLLDYDMSARTGLNIGGVFGLQLANSSPLWLETGVFFAEKGGRQSHPESEAVDHIKCRLTFLEVPVVVKYSMDIADDLYLQPFVGGFFGLGIAGQTKVFTHDTSRRVAKSSYGRINIDGPENITYPGLNRLDAGLRFGCGLEYQMVYAEAAFDFGLANIGKDDFQSVRTQAFVLNVGVNF